MKKIFAVLLVLVSSRTLHASSLFLMTPVKAILDFGPPRAFQTLGAYGIEVPYSSSIGVVDELTVGAWILDSPSDAGNPAIVTRNLWGSHRVWGVEGWNPYFLQMVSQTGSAVRLTQDAQSWGPVFDNRPHFIAWTYKDGTAKLYQDGALVTTPNVLTDNRPFTGSPALLATETGTPFTIGRYPIGSADLIYFGGLIYQPRLFHKELDATQIAEWYNGGAPIELSALSFKAYCAAAFRFDKRDSPGHIHDECGLGNHGTLDTGGTIDNNFVTTFTPTPRYGVQFNGSTQYVSVPHSSSLNITSQATLFIAFRLASGETAKATGNHALMFKGDWHGAGGWAYWVDRNDTNFRVFVSQDGSTTSKWYNYSPAGVNDMGWHSLAVVINASGNALDLYYDGAVQTPSKTTDNSMSAIYGTTLPEYLGAIKDSGTASLLFDGGLSQYRKYNTALTSSQVAALDSDLRSGGTGLTLDSASNCMVGFVMGTGSGTPTFTDICGHSNDGTNVNLTSGSNIIGF